MITTENSIQVQFETHGFGETEIHVISLEAVPRIDDAVLFRKSWWKVSCVSWDFDGEKNTSVMIDIVYIREAEEISK